MHVFARDHFIHCTIVTVYMQGSPFGMRGGEWEGMHYDSDGLSSDDEMDDASSDDEDPLENLEGANRKWSAAWLQERSDYKVYTSQDPNVNQSIPTVRECAMFILNEKRQGCISDESANRLCRFISTRLLPERNLFPR